MTNNEFVNCTNKALVAYFLKNGDIKPCDMFIGRNDTLVFVYKRSDTQLLYDEWMKSREEQ